MRPRRFGAKAIVALISALVAFSMHARAQESARETPGALPQQNPTSPITQTTGPTEPTEPTGSGMILVSKRPVTVLAGPSSSASVLYGFPAGRSFRLTGRKAGFAQIQDLKSSATGWIEETALAQSSLVPATSASEPKPAPSDQTATTASAEPKPPGIFGRGGQGVLSGFLGGVFGTR
jgi:hypothetical protein